MVASSSACAPVMLLMLSVVVPSVICPAWPWLNMWMALMPLRPLSAAAICAMPSRLASSTITSVPGRLVRKACTSLTLALTKTISVVWGAVIAALAASIDQRSSVTRLSVNNPSFTTAWGRAWLAARAWGKTG